MREDRPYQARAKAGVRRSWENGHRSVCLVAPTGAGKTHMSSTLALETEGTVLWSAHRTELVSQAFTTLHSQLGGGIGIIAPGHAFDGSARVQVSSTQTLVQRGRPDIDPKVIVLDEFHHYAANEFRTLIEWWPEARILGPTATPQRGDGRPLKDIATSLVVAAQYGELISDGFLCDAVCYQPPEALQGGIALEPVEAWKKYSDGLPGFAFMPSINEARELAEAFNASGMPAACIDAKTKKSERRGTLERFASGELHVICNVDTMTEGVDVPRAKVAMLGRAFQTVAAYLQACGRVLRPFGGHYARIIDLTGATILHSPPVIDRIYSLEGEGIRKGDSAENPVRNCLECGLVYLCEELCCPACKASPPPKTRRPLRIFSIELQALWAGEHTKEDVKLREYLRLRVVARERGFDLTWVVSEYRRTFGSAPKLFDVTPQEKRAYFHKMAEIGKRTGKKPAFAAARFKDMFGHWPSGRVVN